MRPVGVKFEPRWGQVEPKTDPRGFQEGPRCPQDGSEMAEDGLRPAEVGRMPPKSPKMTPSGRQRRPKEAPGGFHGALRRPRWAQVGPKLGTRWPQEGPKMAPRWPKMGPRQRHEAQDGRRGSENSRKTKMCKNLMKTYVFEGFEAAGEGQVGAKMAPRWAQVGLRWGPEANLRPSSAVLGGRWRSRSM